MVISENSSKFLNGIKGLHQNKIIITIIIITMVILANIAHCILFSILKICIKQIYVLLANKIDLKIGIIYIYSVILESSYL